MKIIFKDIQTKKEYFFSDEEIFSKIELNSAISFMDSIYRVTDKIYILNEKRELKEIEIYLQKYETK